MNTQAPLYTQVFDDLETRIFMGDLPTGTILPAIPELAKQYNVSVITIRGAYKLLAEKQLISVCRGRSAEVVFDTKASLDREEYLRFLAARRGALLDLIQQYKLLIPQAVSFCAPFCRNSVTRELRNLTTTMQPEKMTNLEISDALMHFMYILLQASGNHVLLRIYNSATNLLRLPLLLCDRDAAIVPHFQNDTVGYMKNCVSLLEKGQIDLLRRFVYREYIGVADMLAEFIHHATLDMPSVEPVNFRWMYKPQNDFLYSRVYNELLTAISCGDPLPGRLLPSEASLCAAYSASAITVRKALDMLVQDGYIRTINGVGSQVMPLLAGNVRLDPVVSSNSLRKYIDILQCFAISLPVIIPEAFRKMGESGRQQLEISLEQKLSLSTPPETRSMLLLTNPVLHSHPSPIVKTIAFQLQAELCKTNRYWAFHANDQPIYIHVVNQSLERACRSLVNNAPGMYADACLQIVNRSVFEMTQQIVSPRKDIEE